MDFATIYAREQSGVVRIETLGCAESGIGTGFLLSPTLVATANHVVADSLVISLIDGKQHATGRVIGSNAQRDLALIRSSDPLTGYHFRFATTSPRVGEPVAALGFPIGDPITMTQGGVSGLDRSISVEGHRRTGLIETDAALNPGNSGGPLLSADGRVIGVVESRNFAAAGIAYAVPAAQAEPLMAAWHRAPAPAPPASCDNPLGPPQDRTTLPRIPHLSPGASVGISHAFDRYFNGINTGHYRSAWMVLSPRVRGASPENFAEGVSTSYDFDQRVLDAWQISSTTANVALQFTSLQAAEKGPNGSDTCDIWTLVYTMIELPDGLWYIDATAPYKGRSYTSC